MTIFLDTSVLVAAIIEAHTSHDRAFKILSDIQNGRDEGFISTHSLAEMYSVLTKAPLPVRHTSEQAFFSIEENVIKFFRTITLSSDEYIAMLRESALTRIAGGTIYDALVLRAAEKSEASKIYTFNLRHFQAIAPPKLAPRIFSP